MISKQFLKNTIKDMLKKAVTELDADIKRSLISAYQREENTLAKSQLENILLNAKLAEEERIPMCQDTGLLVFFIKYNPKIKIEGGLKKTVEEAVAEATKEIPLRPNVVDPIKEKNIGNVGMGFPKMYIELDDETDHLEISVLPKGGGSENVSTTQMMRPASGWESLADAAIEALKKAGPKACPPYFLGIGVGDTANVMEVGKKALLHPLEEEQERELKKIEKEIMKRANEELDIGAMGFGGKNTLLGVRIECEGRHPASFPVSFNIQCWANRKAKARIYDGNRVEWLTHKERIPIEIQKTSSSESSVIELRTPLKKEYVEKLNIGDKVLLSGTIYVARDAAHKRMLSLNELPVNLKDGVIYHCGPIVILKQNGGYEINSAGPTTSTRMSPLTPGVMEKYKVRAIIGKGGMDDNVLETLAEQGGVYLAFTGGCGALCSKRIKRVREVHWLDLGTPEALWVLEVENLPLLVAMDSKRKSLYKK